MKPRFPDHFQYLVLDVQDNEEQNLIRLFPQYVVSLQSDFFANPHSLDVILDVQSKCLYDAGDGFRRTRSGALQW